MENTVGKSAYSDHLFQFRTVERKKLILSLSITIIVMIIEIIGGIITNSIALISDAGHMFTHAFAIVISSFGSPSSRNTEYFPFQVILSLT